MYIIAEVGIPILRSKLTTCSDTEMILELHEVVDTAWTQPFVISSVLYDE